MIKNVLSAISPVSNFQALVEIWRTLFQQRALVREMTRRELYDQYVGQVLGVLWVVGYPFIQIAVYVFIFGFVFKAKMGGTLEMPLDYTAYILSGLLAWVGFQQALARSATALTSQTNLVQQVVFPIEVLPVRAVLSSFTGQLIALGFLVLYVLFTHGSLFWTYLLLPVLILFQFMAMLGVGFALAALNPFLRDIKDFVTVYSMIGIYALPVVYSPEWVPAMFKPIIYANPVSYMIWCYQDVLYFGRIAHPIAWVVFLLGAPIALALGYRVFRGVKPYVGNVL
ncbi:ABC transporter permease [Bordetella hinzii]|uniref:Transport permease protein n=1 Tax=Bordetella hinzii TaxID=103855 RepID=A0AAN1RVV3_9BORD|nr:Teichoic acid translocation permease protein TagG [Bordetella hinzii]KXA73679.1 ABC transporter [Bordetella hinzii LMG 13501]AZW16635.1 ABC transporter [Bordetella hinzii]MBZ0074070.1 ABC transporter permease [Bordetella hinzii]MBZ0081350.1 ABC transporter permease [Bordetella hinzii]